MKILPLSAGLTLSIRSHKEEVNRQQSSPQARYVRASVQTVSKMMIVKTDLFQDWVPKVVCLSIRPPRSMGRTFSV